MEKNTKKESVYAFLSRKSNILKNMVNLKHIIVLYNHLYGMSTLSDYDVPKNYLDEVFTGDSKARIPYQKISEIFGSYSPEQFRKFYDNAKLSFLTQGITYQVYHNNTAQEHIFPFDLFPRIIKSSDWKKLETGVLQRNKALNLFLEDVYSEGKVFKDKIIPKEMILSSPHFCEHMVDFKPKGGIYCHISGTDIIKHSDNQFYVLEDNLRAPSGVSYVLSNRDALKKTLTSIFKTNRVKNVHDYPLELLATMQSVSPRSHSKVNCVILTPGIYNSAYFEHAFLAQQMGIELVEGRDLFVENDIVYLKTIRGSKRVDVVYRRIDDQFLDPEVMDKDSVLGVAGLMRSYLKGNVCLINAPGTGIADDKAVYRYVPDLIKYYLGEEPILENVRTYICERPDDLKFVLENLKELVVKPVDLSGGYGVEIGSNLTKEELAELAAKVKAQPRNYVAQPIMSLSLHTTFIESESKFEPRHVDLRTFCLLGDNHEFVLKGGLTRVALRKGSLIVNSSQGGGSKDTWVIENE